MLTPVEVICDNNNFGVSAVNYPDPDSLEYTASLKGNSMAFPCSLYLTLTRDHKIPMVEFCKEVILIYISLWIDCLFEIRKIAVCFLWLSLPGDYRVTDEALLAETT